MAGNFELETIKIDLKRRGVASKMATSSFATVYKLPWRDVGCILPPGLDSRCHVIVSKFPAKGPHWLTHSPPRYLRAQPTQPQPPPNRGRPNLSAVLQLRTWTFPTPVIPLTNAQLEFATGGDLIGAEPSRGTNAGLGSAKFEPSNAKFETIFSKIATTEFLF